MLQAFLCELGKKNISGFDIWSPVEWFRLVFTVCLWKYVRYGLLNKKSYVWFCVENIRVSPLRLGSAFRKFNCFLKSISSAFCQTFLLQYSTYFSSLIIFLIILKGTVQRELRGVKIGINRTARINCIAGKCHLPCPKGHHHERSLNLIGGCSTFWRHPNRLG